MTTPLPVCDGEGMGVAVLMLEKSLEAGRNSRKYKQFEDTCRRLRSAFSNVSLLGKIQGRGWVSHAFVPLG
jgi:hypothetical protein